MNINLVICDKCGKVIKDNKDKITLVIKMSEFDESTTHVLCRKCKNKIMHWLVDDNNDLR